MHRICNMIWRTRQWPTEWTKLVLVPIPKSGDLQDCNNYRNVSVICHASRVLLSIILNRLRQYSERQLPEEQTGFRAGRGTRDALFIMQLMTEKLIDLENKELYFIFIDYSKAFDKCITKGSLILCWTWAYREHVQST